MDERDRPLASVLVVAIPARSDQPTVQESEPGPTAGSHFVFAVQPAGARPALELAGTRPVPHPGETACPSERTVPIVTNTEADGTFTLPILPPGRYVLFALDLGPPATTSEPLVVDGGFLLAPLRLVVSRGASLL